MSTSVLSIVAVNFFCTMNNLIISEDEGLIHVRTDEPGIRRKRSGKGFVYFDDANGRITDKEVIRRIKELSIPPMWENVWICPRENGFLQATGLDARKRKQYLYHNQWVRYQQDFKFQRLSEFARALPDIRAIVEKNLNKHHWPREKVLSLILAILDENYLRVGNRRYYETNETHGLTTLRRKHMVIEGRNMTFQYKGKSNKYHTVQLKNPRLTRLIKQCSELKGYELFKYLDDDGKAIPVDSKDVNEYLKEITGQDFTSKYFRTWGGTVLAIRLFPQAIESIRQNPRLKLEREIVKQVAHRLNNTIAVCKTYYIHPSVLQRLDENFSSEKFDTSRAPVQLAPEEKLAYTIMENGLQNHNVNPL
jgi:DNA topoisomerase I